ncbi:MAG TPA: flagellar FliJ family protein [Pirellulales bacterium]|jgi:flagellar export protein FliJ|nr:flagellar FliJ family protein [Pirellulales bacterium]
MKAFRFRLTSVLKLREATRDERRARLAEAYAAEEKLLARQGTIETDLAGLGQLRHERTATGPVNIDLFVSASRYESVLRHELTAIAGHLATLAAEIERRRQALMLADHEVRMLEKLRDKQRELHRQGEALLETKQLDEIAARQSWHQAHETEETQRFEEIHS